MLRLNVIGMLEFEWGLELYFSDISLEPDSSSMWYTVAYLKNHVHATKDITDIWLGTARLLATSWENIDMPTIKLHSVVD